MNPEVTYTVRVEFGDCDPAGIVWFPNFFRWIDAASRHSGIATAICSVSRGEDLILECEEVRIFAAAREGGGIRAVPIPPEIRRLCE